MEITINNLKQYSMQAVFDAVATHMLKQGEPAYDSIAGQCRYRTADGLKCAVGFLIPEDMYAKLEDVIEGNSVTGPIFDQYFVPFERVYPPREFGDYRDNAVAADIDKYRGMLKDLQIVHDDAEDVEYAGLTASEFWRERLESVADKYGLNTQVLQ